MDLPSTLPVTPLPVGESNSFASLKSRLRSFAARRIASASGCSLARSTLAARRRISVSSKSVRGNDGDHLRLAFGQRARLVDHQRVDLFHALERFGILDQHAGLGAASDADHDRHRRGKPERAGAGDDQDADGCDQAERHPGFRSEPGPDAERNDSRNDHGGNEPAGDLIGQPLDRRARALRVRDHLHDLRQQRVAPDLVGAHHEAAGLIERARDHPATGLFGDGHGFACHQGLVERGAALENDAVHRHLLARPHPQTIADLQAVDLDLMVGTVLADAAGGFRRQLREVP